MSDIGVNDAVTFAAFILVLGLGVMKLLEIICWLLSHIRIVWKP